MVTWKIKTVCCTGSAQSIILLMFVSICTATGSAQSIILLMFVSTCTATGSA